MKKRIISLFAALFLIVCPSIRGYGYTVGPTTYAVPLGSYTELTNAKESGKGIRMENGGMAVYDIYVPFNSVSVTIQYEAAAHGTAKLQLDDKEWPLSIQPSENKTTVTFDLPERIGEKALSLRASGAVTITGIEFAKEDVETPSATKKILPALTEQEQAIQTAVIVGSRSAIMLVNGARRYINYDNPAETPLTVEGKLYLPIAPLARALGFYYEDLPEQGYFLLRTQNLEKGNVEFYRKDDALYRHWNGAEPELIKDVSLYVEGRTYLPIRFFAEEIGETVGYRDGIVAIDNGPAVRNILSNDTVFRKVLEEFEQYTAAPDENHTYYVAQTPEASDENDGSEAAPFRTLAMAAETAKAGDTVIIRSGVYREVLAPKNNGMPTKPIVFQAAEGEDVTISANEAVPGNFAEYELNGHKILVARLDGALENGRNQVFYHGEALAEARHPNTDTSSRETLEHLGLSKLFPTQGDIKVSDTDQYLAVSPGDLDQPDDFWKGGVYVSLHSLGWSLGTADIVSSSKGELHLANTTKNWWFASFAIADNFETDCGYITGVKNAIDAPGEWNIENDVLYIYPPEGESAETLQLEIKRRQLVLDLANSRYVQVKGIHMTGGGVRMNDSEMCVLDGCDIRYLSHYTSTMDQREGFIDDQNVSDPNGAPPRGEMGIYLGGRDNAVRNCRIDYSAAAGIYLVGKYEYIENNIISNCGYMGSYVAGLYSGVEAWEPMDTPRGGHGIFQNSLYNAGRSTYNVGTTESWLNGAQTTTPMLPDEVAYNEFYNSALCGRDVGIVYFHGVVQGSDRLKTKFHHNVVYDGWSHDKGNETHGNAVNFGVYYDNFAEMSENYDNIVFNTRQESAFQETVFAQLKSGFPTSYAYEQMWNNQNVGYLPEGKEALRADHFPNGRPFQFGANPEGTPYLKNYQTLHQRNMQSSIVNAKCSDGVRIEDGIVRFSGNDQWLEISDVDFGCKADLLAITYTQDCYRTGDAIQIVVGDSLGTGRRYNVKDIRTESPYLNSTNTLLVEVDQANGPQKVFIRTVDYHSIGITSVSASLSGLDKSYITKLYGGEYDSLVKGGAEPVTRYEYKDYYSGWGDKLHPIINNTVTGMKLGYRDVYLRQEAKNLEISYATDGQWSGNTVSVHIGSPDTEPIATTTLEGSSWNNYVTKTIELAQPLPAGEYYDVYVVFGGDGKTSNFYYLGFKPAEDAEKMEGGDVK